ncbi:AfsR/SARP family transcriptional regulator [Micromonospora sp. CPCC 206061]|uniref:AfsR/SARP family transcriptional regulator n=1 Tax=Micromonospora sp. CPCC 206061 TaxID=3122410 RepID=UPI002FF1240A
MYSHARSLHDLDRPHNGSGAIATLPQPNNVIPLPQVAARMATKSLANLDGHEPESGGFAATAAHLRLLGAFQLSVAGRPVPIGLSAQRLLALLALHEEGVARLTAAGQLWPATTDARAQANLRTALYRLGTCRPLVVEVTKKDLRLAPTVSVDARQINGLAAQLLARDASLSPRQLTWTMSCDLYHDLLPDWDEEWLRPEQQRFRHVRLHCLEALGSQLAANGRYGAAVDAALAAVQADPFRETAHELLIRVHLAEGNRNDAVRHYLGFRRRLRDELGLEPSARLGHLLQSA